MPAVPLPPRSPTRHRKNSSIYRASLPSSPQINTFASRRPSTASVRSRPSFDSPDTSWSPSLLEHDAEPRSPSPTRQNIDAKSANNTGLGNLADELAEAWEEEGEDRNVIGGSLDAELEEAETFHDGADGDAANGTSYHRARNAGATQLDGASLSPPKQYTKMGRRRPEADYDGSEYGEDSDLDDDQTFSPSLESQLAAIERLARPTSQGLGQETEDLVSRFIASLKELPSQSSTETGVSRVITSHSAITTHLTHQLRALMTVAHPLLSPLSLPPDPSIIDQELLPLLTTLSTALPEPLPRPLPAIRDLTRQTADLTSTLTTLSDSAYVTHSTGAHASRKLKSAVDLVAALRKETEAKEEAIRWIAREGWEARLRNRECAGVCGDLVRGFEEVCDGWRERLMSGGGPLAPLSPSTSSSRPAAAVIGVGAS